MLGCLAGCCLAAGTAWAQATVSWSGVVRSASGQPVAGVVVVITKTTDGKPTDDVHNAKTGTDGAFSFADLVPGHYSVGILVAAPNSPQATAAKSLTVDLPAPAAILTVSDEVDRRYSISMAPLPATPAAGTNTETATGGEKLSSQSVSSLPLNGRDFSTLLLLAAGTMTDVNGATNFTQQFAINGQRGV